MNRAGIHNSHHAEINPIPQSDHIPHPPEHFIRSDVKSAFYQGFSAGQKSQNEHGKTGCEEPKKYSHYRVLKGVLVLCSVLTVGAAATFGFWGASVSSSAEAKTFNILATVFSAVGTLLTGILSFLQLTEECDCHWKKPKVEQKAATVEDEWREFETYWVPNRGQNPSTTLWISDE